MSVGDVLQVKFASWLDNQLGLNIRYYKITAQDFLDNPLNTVATFIQGQIGPSLVPCMCGDAEFLGCSVKRVFPLPVTLALTSSGAAAQGTAGASALPTQTCGVITLRSAFAGRTNRGRVYVPFPSESDNEPDGHPVSTYVTRLQTLATAFATVLVFIGPISTITLQPVICQPSGILTVNVISGLARASWATQRRRGMLGAKNPKEIPL